MNSPPTDAPGLPGWHHTHRWKGLLTHRGDSKEQGTDITEHQRQSSDVVADASTLRQVAFARVAEIDEGNALTIHYQAEPEKLYKLHDAGLDVITA
jgi:DeoR/GlpR family transcriptional regulator of sugar metabolism